MNSLTEEKEEELLKWIEKFELSRPSKKLSRDFSDAVLLAEILKFLFPKLVELHNYPSRNSFQHKLDNWATLNRKVLRKINAELDTETMKRLSQADPKTIELVLYDVMKKSQQALEAKLSDTSNSSENSGHSEIMTINVQTPVGDRIEMVPKKMIIYSMYENLERLLEEKNQIIQVLSQKNGHLENLLKLKSERIEDLESQVVRLNNKKTFSIVKNLDAELY